METIRLVIAALFLWEAFKFFLKVAIKVFLNYNPKIKAWMHKELNESK